MHVDRFTELSAERFSSLEPGYQGHSVMLFPYVDRSAQTPVHTLGLWMSRQVVKTQIEAAHYIPDSECQDALVESRGAFAGSFVWLGLLVEVDADSDAHITMPEFMLSDNERRACEEGTPLKVELEERFNVQISMRTS